MIFITFYNRKWRDYIELHKNTFGLDYFVDWYLTYGASFLCSIMGRLDISKIDKRVCGFTALYRCYITRSLNEKNDELLLENLFAVPEQMYYEFCKFGYFRGEK